MIDSATIVATSPQQIQAITDLVKTTLQDSPAKEASLFQPDVMTAWASLIGSVAWPAVALSAILVFREPIADLLARAQSVKAKGVEIKLRELKQQVEAAGVDAGQSTGLSHGPTTQERKRATAVAALAVNAPAEDLREVAKNLAREYENIRITHLPSPSRTHLMEIVVAKMRAMSNAVYPLRHEFMASPSPGERLVAIAAMQVTPDYDSLGWLVDRLVSEKPFVGYHAAVALNVAAKQEQAASHKEALVAAGEAAKKAIVGLSETSDRTNSVNAFLDAIKGIHWTEDNLPNAA